MRSVLSVRGAAPAQRQTAGLLPVIRKAKGMNRQDGFHWECPNIGIRWMQTNGDINRPLLLLWSLWNTDGGLILCSSLCVCWGFKRAKCCWCLRGLSLQGGMKQKCCIRSQSPLNLIISGWWRIIYMQAWLQLICIQQPDFVCVLKNVLT